MSLVCSISGEVPEHPVVSPVSKHVFEKRLIEKFIVENGTVITPAKDDKLLAGITRDLVVELLKENNIKLYVSGMSAKARGYDESLLNGFNAEYAMPDKLLYLSTESDTVLCY